MTEKNETIEDDIGLSKMTSLGERVSYWSYFVGQSMSYTMLAAFLTSYMLLIGVDLGKIALAMVVVKIWDAVNDTLFGIIFDKVKFKSGNKSLPWLRISSALIPITTILIFIIPRGLDSSLKLVWVIVAYVLWDAAYTLSDVPIYSMATTMTANVQERNKLLSLSRIFALAAAFILSMIATVLVSEQVGMSFSLVAILTSVIIALTMLPISIKGKERVDFTRAVEDSYTIKGLFKYLNENKYLLLYYSGYIVFGIAATGSALGLFVSYYLFGSALFSVVLQLIQALPMILVTIFINMVLKKVDKFALFFYSNIVFALMSFIMYFVGYKNITLYIILLVINSIPYATIYILNLTFTPDCVEYGQYKTKVDARGMAFAIQSFAAKFTSLAQPLGLLILGFFGWKTIEAESFAHLDKLVKTGEAIQSSLALKGLWFTYTLVPAIGAVLAIVLYSFYKLNDHDVQIMARYNMGEISKEQAESLFRRKH